MLVPAMLMVLSCLIETGDPESPSNGLNHARDAFSCSIHFHNVVIEFSIVYLPMLLCGVMTMFLLKRVIQEMLRIVMAADRANRERVL